MKIKLGNKQKNVRFCQNLIKAILILATGNQSFLCVRRKVKFDQRIGEKTETFSKGKLKSTPAA